MNQDPSTRHESVSEQPELICTYESPAGTKVTRVRQGPVSTGAMARHVSTDLSEQLGRPMNIMAGSDWLTFTGTDQGQRAKEISTLIGESFVPSDPRCRGLGPVLVPGESGSSPTEMVPSTTLVVGYDGTGVLRTQEEVDTVVGMMQQAAVTLIEQQMP